MGSLIFPAIYTANFGCFRLILRAVLFLDLGLQNKISLEIKTDFTNDMLFNFENAKTA